MERKKLVELLNNRRYKQLETIIIEDDNKDPFIEFLNAFIHESEDYDDFSLFKAKQIYEESIERDDSIWQSFYYFALHLLRNKNDADKERAKIILKDGLVIHPYSELILYTLLKLLTPKDLAEFVISEVDIKKLASTETVLPHLILHCFNNKNIKLFKWLIKADVLDNYINNEEYEIALVIGYLFYINSDNMRAKEYFKHVASYARNITKSYALLGNVLTSEQKDYEATVEALPMTYGIEPISYKIDGKTQYILFKDFIQELFDAVLAKDVIKNNDRLTAKLRGIRGYLKFESEDSGGISDLKSAIKHFRNKDYFYALNMTYYYKDKYKEAFKYGIEYFYLASKEEKAKDFCSFVIPNNKNHILDLIKMINSNKFRFYDSKKEFFEFVVAPVVEELDNQEEYKLVCDLAKSYDFHHVVEKVGFEVAYAYYQCGDNELAKKYYEYLKNDPSLVSSASLNNLAMIYSAERNFEQAIELRKKALEISQGNTDYKKRLDDEIERFTSYKNIMKEDLEALNSLMDENGWVLNILNNFYEHIDDNGFIECPHRLLPKYLRLNKLKADEMIHYFMDKKYLRKVGWNEHNIDTQSTVYKVNIDAYNVLKDIFDKEEIFNDLSICLNDFTPNKLIELGYTNSLLEKIKSLNDINFLEMVNRDLRENVIALITKSYKSSLVISGSIVEALMMYKLKENDIERHKFSVKGGNEKTIKVKEMSLSQLITVAEYHRIFTHEALKHSDAIRGYRNLIHPGVEVRKSKDTPSVTEDNVQLAWMVLKKVISEI